jgi:hypothetical protein
MPVIVAPDEYELWFVLGLYVKTKARNPEAQQPVGGTFESLEAQCFGDFDSQEKRFGLRYRT